MTEIPNLPTRAPRNRAMAATLEIWHCRDRGLIQRTLDGLRSPHPAACQAEDHITSSAHAHMIMAAHAAHRGCPRYTRAANYALAVQ